MQSKKFNVYEVSENSMAIFESKIVKKEIADLPQGDVLIKVKYSSLNYKDALSATGNRGVTKEYPHTPGIDAAGVVEQTSTERFSVGDRVIVTGYDLGMNTAGGFGGYIRVPSDWVVKCPNELTLRECMIYGTAGFTAALSVKKLIDFGIHPVDGEVLVTGGTGGVGSIAISLLSKLGYDVIASTSKPLAKDFLKSMGAKDIISRNELCEEINGPMLQGRWSGVVDAVGGTSLANALKAVKYGGCITCCGNVAGDEFTSSVYPFILRGISLFGIDSVQSSLEMRNEIWYKLGTLWRIDSLERNTREVTLEELDERIELMLLNKHVGRVIVSLE